MRLVCPSCAAEYEVPDEAVPEEGRDVQCGTCSTSWFQERPVMALPDPEPLAEQPSESIAEPVIPEDLPGVDTGIADIGFGTSDAAGQTADAPIEDRSEPVEEPASVALSETDDGPVEAEEETGPVSEAEPVEEAEPEPLPEDEPVAELEPAAETEPVAEPEPAPETEPVSAAEAEPASEAEAGKTERPSGDLDFDFDFDFEDDEPAAAAPEVVAEETTQARRFDKSLHAKPVEGRSGSPNRAQESPQATMPDRPEPEDLSAPGETASSDEEDDLLAAVRGELDKMDEIPKPGDASQGARTGKRTGVAAAAEASGIVFDSEFEDDEFGFSAQDLGDTLQQSDLEDLSAPESKAGGSRFSTGFATAMILFALGLAAYLLGPSISDSYPPAEPYLTGYTNTVDQTRQIIEELSSSVLGFAEDKMNDSDGS